MPRLSVKITPNSSRTKVLGWLGEDLKLSVQAPPENGKANAAVQALLAEVLRISPKKIALLSGATNPRKVFDITGLTDAELSARLPKK
jgi:uncharacterized protein (TIGR00251 family)